MTDSNLDFSTVLGILGAIGALINIIIISWQAWKKSKPEIRKLDAETEVGEAEADLHAIEGAKISMEMLQQTVIKLQKDIEAEKEARKKDNEYFRRRIREMDRENREYRQWAARLVKQVISAGLIPVPFETISDSDPSLPPLETKDEQ